MGADEVTLAEPRIATGTDTPQDKVVLLPSQSVRAVVPMIGASPTFPYLVPGLEDNATRMPRATCETETALRMSCCANGSSTQQWQQATPHDATDHLIGILTTQEPSRWKEYVSKRLVQIEARAADETSEDPYPSAELVRVAHLVVARLFSPSTPTPSVVPSEEGGVSFVWHKGGLDVEIEVGEDEIFVCANRRASGDSFYGSLTEHYELIQGVLRYLALIP